MGRVAALARAVHAARGSRHAVLVPGVRGALEIGGRRGDRKSTRLNSSHSQISYAVFCLEKQITISAHITQILHSSSPLSILRTPYSARDTSLAILTPRMSRRPSPHSLTTRRQTDRSSRP